MMRKDPLQLKLASNNNTTTNDDNNGAKGHPLSTAIFSLGCVLEVLSPPTGRSKVTVQLFRDGSEGSATTSVRTSSEFCKCV